MRKILTATDGTCLWESEFGSLVMGDSPTMMGNRRKKSTLFLPEIDNC